MATAGPAGRGTRTDQTRTDGKPVLEAFVLAGLAALVLWFAAYFVYAIFAEGPVRASQQVPYLLIGGLLFAAPAVVTVLLFVATPLFLLLRRFHRITLVSTVVTGVLCGLAGRTGVLLLWGQPEVGFVPVLVVALAGAGGGAVWWWAWWGRGRKAQDA